HAADDLHQVPPVGQPLAVMPQRRVGRLWKHALESPAESLRHAVYFRVSAVRCSLLAERVIAVPSPSKEMIMSQLDKVDVRCAIRITVRSPSRSSMDFMTSRSVWSSRALVASSSTSTLAWRYSARAMPMRCL